MKVYFSKRATNKLHKLLDYLESDWSEKVRDDFIQKLDNAIGNIKQFPESFPESKRKQGYRKCILTKQISIYYRIKNKEIEVSTLFDNRQKPNKLNKEIK